MSLKKDSLSWAIIVLVLVGAATAAFYTIMPHTRPHTTLHLGDGIFSTDIVLETMQSGKHIAGAKPLESNQAILAVYGGDSRWTVATKGADDSFDLVWLDGKKRVVYIVKNVSDVNVTEYVPRRDARYVVELPVGTVSSRAISIGATASFDEDGVAEAQL